MTLTWFLTFAFLFMQGAFFGWILEVLYRKMFSRSNPDHRWINPGFLTGPWLPLYGFGLFFLYLLCRIDLSFAGAKWLQCLLLFFLMGVAMTLTELIAGLIFIRGLHVKLWDYSHIKGNWKGIICPRFSLIWTGLGVAFYFLVFPIADAEVSWLSSHLTFLFAVGILYGIFFVDFCFSMQLGRRIRAYARDNRLVVRYEAFKIQLYDFTHGRLRDFWFGVVNGNPIAEALREYRDKYDESHPRAAERRRQRIARRDSQSRRYSVKKTEVPMEEPVDTPQNDVKKEP